MPTHHQPAEFPQLRQQLADVEFRAAVVHANDRPQYEALAKRIRSYLARNGGGL